MKLPAVYILASQKRGTLYIGVTSDLIKRVYQHKSGLVEGFTNHYQVKKLVYFEQFEDMHTAISREKLLKKWKRDWKIALVEESNPGWRDLYLDIC